MLPAPQQVAHKRAAPDKTVPAGSGASDTPDLAVVVVAGTKVRQNHLAALLARRDVTVLGTARDGAAALDLLAETAPQALLLDLAPENGGLDLVEQLMARRPLPIVLTGAAATDPATALARGAVDVVPTAAERGGPTAYSDALRQHLQVASRVRVITHPRGRLRERAEPERVERTERPAAARPRRGSAQDGRSGVTLRSGARPPVVAIGASTGGPPALAALLAALPADLPAAVVVVQHMAEGFVGSLASWLAGVSSCPVRVADDGDRLVAGTVLLAPSHANLELDRTLRVHLTPPRAGQLHVPEVDTTFRSVSHVCGERSVGALLTGMGRDGAAGLLALRQHGAYTIGQDEASSAVWGMPAAAQAVDAVMVELPLEQIAQEIVAAVARITARSGP